MFRNTISTIGFVLACIVLSVPVSSAASTPKPADSEVDPWRLCMEATADAERAHNIPRHLLAAIAVAESGRWNRKHRANVAWPWTVMAEGKGRYLPTKAEAIATVRALKARKIQNIDVGCMQINLRHHPAAFTDLEQAFDPGANVAYGSTYLKALFEETGSWQKASGRYHSATPKFNRPYRLRVLKLWNEQTRLAFEAKRADRKRRANTRRTDRSVSTLPTKAKRLFLGAATVRCPPGSNARYACRAMASAGRRGRQPGG